jgi:hypothetical protein
VEAVLKAIEAAKANLDGQDIEALPLDEQMERLGLIGHADATTPGDERDYDPPLHPAEDVSAETSRARSADAVVRLAQAYLEPGLRPRSLAEQYQVHVHLDLRTGAGGPIEDPDAPPLAEQTIRRLGCEAALVGVLHEGGHGLKATDDGALIFTRPDGERIPTLPRPFVPAGDLADVDTLHDVSAETFLCRWDGRPPDYGAMVELLSPPPPT